MALVVVQRGHVPRTTGATGAPGEQEYAIRTAGVLAPRIKALGHDVRIIDADEADDRYRGDLFVALHWDSSTSPEATGASVGYQTPEGEKFASAWKTQYVRAGWIRGFRGDNYTAALGGYYGVRHAKDVGNRMAIITEAGFQSNAGDLALMSPERTAISIAAAVKDMVGGTAPPLDEQDEDDEMVILRYKPDPTRVVAIVGGKRIPITGEANVTSARGAGIPVWTVDDDEWDRFNRAFPTVR